MKNIFIIIIVLFVSCSTKENKKTPEVQVHDSVLQIRKEYASSYREPNEDSISLMSRRNRDLFHHTCASGYEDQTYGSEGVSASANVMKLSLQGAKIKSWWIGAYYYDTLPDGKQETNWVQWGYAVDGGGLFQAFYVYKISPVYGQKWPLTIINQDNSVPLAYGSRVRFEIIRVPETTFWSFLRDGKKVFDVDLGVTTLDGKLQSCTESWGTSSFSNIVHVNYLDTYKNGTWSHLPSGQITSISWRLVAGPEKSEHEFGGKIQNPVNYLLW